MRADRTGLKSKGKLSAAGNKPILVERVTVRTDDVTHEGAYYVNGSVLHVRSPLGAKATQVGGSPPKAIAELLLSELVAKLL